MNSNIFIVKHARKDNWSGVSHYNKCKTYLRANLTRTGSLNTGLTLDDEKRLEQALGYSDGELAKSNIEFWKSYSVVVDETGLTLNIDNPYDELRYLLLKSHKRVANGIDMLNPSKDFVMINKESEAIAKNKVNRKKIDAIVEYKKMTPEQMRRCLKVLGINAGNSSVEVVESSLFEFIENNPADFFIKWVENNDRDIEYLISQAVTKNIVRKNRTSYYYGTDLLGGTLEDAIAYMKDKKNSDIRKAIMNAVDYKEDPAQ